MVIDHIDTLQSEDSPGSQVWDERAAETYDAQTAGRFSPHVLGPEVSFLEDLAQDGPALEFAIGTGRVAIPLAGRGVPVTGIELSAPMVARLRRKVDALTLPVVIGDMATATVPGQFALVYVVWNSISNLQTQHQQVQCFRNAARHLRPGGCFVVELWVPDLSGLSPSGTVAREIRDGFAAFDTYDPTTQECTSQTFTQEPDGHIRHDQGRFRYIWPSECDLMAELAGMHLVSRVADWNGSPFTSSSTNHVSVWRT